MASGVKHGFGLWNGGTYIGEFKNGLPHGKGKMMHDSGYVYVGKAKQGMKHGYGKLSNVDGRMYEGQWRNDRKHGHGMFSWPDSHMYEGQWRHGVPHGHGKYTSICKEAKNFVYEGEFKDDNFHGQGRLEYADGIVWEGEFKNNSFRGGLVFSAKYKHLVEKLHLPMPYEEQGKRANAQEKRTKALARWQRCIRVVLKQLREDKAATARNVAESARRKAVRDAIKRNKETLDAAWGTSTVLRGQRHEAVKALPEAPDAAASAVRQTEKEANLVRLHEQTVARCAKEAENRARLAERKANIRVGFKINEQE